MNATSLYVSTSRLVLQNDQVSDQNLLDLYRLVPYLRQSLSCAVCGNLLIEPHTPTDGHCQHHVCKMCVRGRKILKPACNWCKEYEKYEENLTLRILLQCYKSLCEHIMNSPIFNMICKQTKATGVLNNGATVPSVTLVEFIEEGAKFQDVFKATSGLTKSAYSILPCVFPCPPLNVNNKSSSNSTTNVQSQTPQQVQSTQFKQLQHQQNSTHHHNSHQQQQQSQQNHQASSSNFVISTSSKDFQQPQQQQQQQPQQQQQQPLQQQHKTTPISHLPPIKTVSNGSTMYSVLYTGIGNKITIKRKINDTDDSTRFQHIIRPIRPISKRRGCRCGNATATPGKLTCCGQRCPCYVDQKSCIDCKCRGCRNPHRPDGGKVRPHIPELACYEIQLADDSTTTNLTSSLDIKPINSRTTNCLEIPLDNFPTNRLTSPPSKSTSTTATTNTNTSAFDSNHSLSGQPIKIENLSRESLVISSPEGNFQVVNVFTSNPQQQCNTINNRHHQQYQHQTSSIINAQQLIHHNNQHQQQQHARENSHQIPEISTTLPQILLQKQEPMSLSPSPPSSISSGGGSSSCGGGGSNNIFNTTTSGTVRSTITAISPGPSHLNTITLSPIIVNSSSNPFPTQIFSEEEIITTQCTPSPTQPPPLIELTSSEHSSGF